MKRRSFFKVFAALASTAIAPAIVLQPVVPGGAFGLPLMTALGELEEAMTWHLELQCWVLCYTYRDVKGNQMWHYARLTNVDPRVMPNKVLEFFRNDAKYAIEQELRRPT